MTELKTNFNNFNAKISGIKLQIYENGTDTTNQYKYDFDKKTGMFTLIRKDHSDLKPGHLIMITDYTVEQVNPNKVQQQVKPKLKKDGEESSLNKINSIHNEIHVQHQVVTLDTVLTINDKNNLEQLSINQIYQEILAYATMQSSTVYEDNKEVNDKYLLTDQSGAFYAELKDTTNFSATTVKLETTWLMNTDIEPNVKLTLFGEAILNGNHLPAERVERNFVLDPSLLWQPGTQRPQIKSNVSETESDIVLTMDLPPQKKLANPLKEFQMIHNYSSYEKSVANISINVMENMLDVTNEYKIAYKDGKVLINRKHPENLPDGKIMVLISFKFNDKIHSGMIINNNGSVIIEGAKADYSAPVQVYNYATDNKSEEKNSTNNKSEESIASDIKQDKINSSDIKLDKNQSTDEITEANNLSNNKKDELNTTDKKSETQDISDTKSDENILSDNNPDKANNTKLNSEKKQSSDTKSDKNNETDIKTAEKVLSDFKQDAEDDDDNFSLLDDSDLDHSEDDLIPYEEKYLAQRKKNKD